MNYRERKERARQEAIEWQLSLSDFGNYSYLELSNWYEHFYQLGKRYGLLKEFRENGII